MGGKGRKYGRRVVFDVYVFGSSIIFEMASASLIISTSGLEML